MIPPVLPTYARADVAFTRGEGPYLFDEKNRRYLDFGSGIAVSALGHCHAHLVSALQDQAARLWHTSNLYRIPGQQKLAERLVAQTFADTVFFTNSGAEAVECAIKIARRYQHASGAPERFRLITFQGAFHGRTLATIAAGGSPKYLEGFGPPVDGFDQVAVGDMDAVMQAAGPQTAGILIEPVQGEVGVRVPPPGFLRRLREFCDAKGLLLIFDEVQTGVGRLGRLFAYEETGIAPDIMSIGKGIGGGFPLGACLASERAAKGMTAGSHGSTYGGNPLAMAAGNAVLDIVLAPGFLDSVRRTAGHFQQSLAGLAAEYPGIVEEVRGRGLLLGLKLRIPAAQFITRLREHDFLAVGATDNVVRLLPPLNIEEKHIREAMQALAATCASFAKEGAEA
ncbi:MAG TPA: aspartate aminotransferase family protein [Micropepsaceae bacterium]|nr:aspartate aminotransferase family protein [Micropepsaceae bacterium]